jgi:type I restriction enzyme M protein
MSSKVSALPISELKKAELREYIAEQALIGVDVARDPALARIARINMYLHGDGGTSIYQLDALDKKVTRLANDPPELVQEKDEFRKRVSQGEKVIDGHPQGLVDVVLTNPPFAKEYDRSQANEARLLDDYELGFITDGGARRPVASLSSMVMFLERYYDLLAPGGRLVTVLDDGILGAPKHKRVREWIRKNWIVRAVVSLPGDAFQRSQARVKTSILVLEKKTDQTEDQPDVFMYYCTAVGVDDTPRQRSRPVDDENRLKANEEIANAVSLFKAFLNGDTVASAWRVPAAAISDRMDVKACLPESGALVDEWTREGLDVRKVSDMLGVVDETSKSVDTDFDFRILDTRNTDETITYLRVRYDGFCEAGDEAVTSDLSAQRFTRVREGDIVFSHINTVHGAVGIVPDWLEGTVVTNEYTVCRSTGTIPAEVLWALLRSPQARADLLLMSTGIGRTRVKWATIRDLRLPVPGTDAQKKLVAALNGATEAERAAARQRADATSTLQRTLRLQASDAYDIIAAFKPPR